MPRGQKRKYHSTSSTTCDVSSPDSGKENNDLLHHIKYMRKEYESIANEEYALAMKKYMRGQFNFFGIKAPERRVVDKKISRQLPAWDANEKYKFMELLWEQDEREYQLFGIDYIKEQRDILSSDLNHTKESLLVISNLIKKKSWWDTVDMLACRIVGHFVQKYPKEMSPIMDDWILDSNMWIRRTAILHQLSYKKETDKSKLFRYCLSCADEKEFFIQKAIGWSLREYSKHNATAVRKFIKDNENKLAKLSVREGKKYL